MIWIRITTLLFIAGTVWAWMSGSAELWGIYHLRFMPVWLAWLLFTVGMAVVLLPRGSIQRLIDLTFFVMTRIPRSVMLIIAGIALISLFIAGRCENLLLGDSFRLIRLITEDFAFSPTEHVTLLINHLLFVILGDPRLAYSVTSVLSGVAFVFIVSRFVLELDLSAVGRSAILLMFLSLGNIQLFFCYPENYTIVSALLASYLYYGWRAVDGRSPVWPALLLFIAALTAHLSAVFVLPGLIYLMYKRYHTSKRGIWLAAAVGAGVAAIAGGILYYTSFGGDEIFCPIIANETNPYSIFSLQHAADLANLLLLVSPLQIIWLIYLTVRLNTGRASHDRASVFLTLSLAGTLCLTLFVDPKLGALRDWDLLALYGIPLTFLIAVLFQRSPTKDRDARVLLLSALAVIIIHTVPWIVSNASRSATYPATKEVIANDIHYSESYYNADRMMSWGLIAADSFNDIEELERCFIARTNADPHDYRSWLYLARGCTKLGDRECVERALRSIPFATPFTFSQWKLYVRLSLHNSLYEPADSGLATIYSRYRADQEVYMLDGILEFQRGKIEAAVELFKKAASLGKPSFELLEWQTRASVLLKERGKTDSLGRAEPQLRDSAQ